MCIRDRYQVESVAQTIQQEYLIRDCHYDEESVVEGPLYISNVFAYVAPLCDRLEFLDFVWVV